MVFAACSQVMAISSRPVKTDSDERLYDILDDCWNRMTTKSSESRDCPANGRDATLS